MLTRPSAEGAAAAAAAVVASAASVAFEAAQAWTVGGARGGVFLRSTHARARPALVPFLRALKAVGGNERLEYYAVHSPYQMGDICSCPFS